MATDLAALRLSPTVQGVAAEIGDAPVPAWEVVTRILARHRTDYAGGRHPSVEWPSASRTAPVGAWLRDVDRLFSFETETPLFGRAVILGLGLVDPTSGRRMVESGLFHALASEFEPPLLSTLSPRGLARLRAIPLAAAVAGV